MLLCRSVRSKGKHIQNTHQGIQFTLEEEDLVASCNVVRVSCNFEEQDFGGLTPIIQWVGWSGCSCSPHDLN